jgi:ribonuclease VapC
VIAVDTSALVAYALLENEAGQFGSILKTKDCLIGAPTLLEVHMVLSSRKGFGVENFFNVLERFQNIEIIPFGPPHLAAARSAFERYGKGRNSDAALNYGDCMAYAVAKVHNVPLLFKGNDFHATDIIPAIIL